MQTANTAAPAATVYGTEAGSIAESVSPVMAAEISWICRGLRLNIRQTISAARQVPTAVSATSRARTP